MRFSTILLYLNVVLINFGLEYVVTGFFYVSTFNQDCAISLRHFQQYQGLPTKGAHDVQHFSINGSLFLAFANYFDDVERWRTSSFIYKMNPSTDQFVLYQTIDIVGAFDVEYFNIGNKHNLAIASHNDGITYRLDSRILQWNGNQFVPFQSIATNGAASFTFFKIMEESFLAVSNFYNDTSHSISSIVYKWNINKFEKYQEIQTEGALSGAALEIHNETFFVFGNFVNAKHGHSVNSTVYKWSGGYFAKFQSLESFGAWHVEFFKSNRDTFLAFANHHNGTTYNLESFIYKWNGSKFVLFQSIPTRGASALYPFVVCGQMFVTAVNFYDENVQRYSTTSDVYQFTGGHLIKRREIPTEAALAVTAFEFKNQFYVVFVSYYSEIDNKHKINSKLFKWI